MSKHRCPHCGRLWQFGDFTECSFCGNDLDSEPVDLDDPDDDDDGDDVDVGD